MNKSERLRMYARKFNLLADQYDSLTGIIQSQLGTLIEDKVLKVLDHEYFITKLTDPNEQDNIAD